MFTLIPKQSKDTTLKGKVPTAGMGHDWSRPGSGRGGKHKPKNNYNRKREKAVERD